MRVTEFVAGDKSGYMASLANYSANMMYLVRVAPNIERAWAQSLWKPIDET